MKKFYGIVSVLALIVALVGIIMGGIGALAIGEYILVLPILASAFIFAKNKVMQNVGFSLCGLAGAIGVVLLLGGQDRFDFNPYFVFAIGLAIYILIALVKLISLVLAFFGYRKSKPEQTDVICILKEAKQLEADGLLDEDEFAELKGKIINKDTATVSSFEELRTWKKLYDQQILSDKEFSELKSKILK